MKRIHSNIESHQNRRGIAILWLILWGGVFLIFFCVVLEIATMWQTQVEVNNALDAAALAAVKEWGEQIDAIAPPPPDYSTQTPRDVGIAFAAANPILGSALVLTDNYDPTDDPNENETSTGNFIFGGLDSTTSPITFNANADAFTEIPAVRAQVTVPVQGFCTAMFGVTPFYVSAKSTAYYDTVSGQPALVRISTFNGP